MPTTGPLPEPELNSAAVDAPTAPPVSPILKYFDFEHLPLHLQNASEPFHALAHGMEYNLPNGPEKSAGLRKLLEAKDCAVRALL